MDNPWSGGQEDPRELWEFGLSCSLSLQKVKAVWRHDRGTEEAEKKQVWCVVEARKDEVLVTKLLSTLGRRGCWNFVSIRKKEGSKGRQWGGWTELLGFSCFPQCCSCHTDGLCKRAPRRGSDWRRVLNSWSGEDSGATRQHPRGSWGGATHTPEDGQESTPDNVATERTARDSVHDSTLLAAKWKEIRLEARCGNWWGPL